MTGFLRTCGSPTAVLVIMSGRLKIQNRTENSALLRNGEDTSFAQDLAQDVLEIITVFSARLYGAHSKKNNNLIDGLKAAAAR
jgi:predicted site-specific integrase-resolvase